MSLWRRVLLLGFGVGLMACSPDRAQLVVVVRSDLLIPSELDAIQVELLETSNSQMELRTIRITELPVSFGIAPRSDLDQPVHLRISAMHGGTATFSTEVRTRFVSGRVLRLDVFLASRCIGVTCADNQTCRRPGCQPIEIPPETLPENNTDAGPEDGGVDAGAMDGGVDAGTMDAGGMDAGAMDAGMVDAGMMDANVVTVTPGDAATSCSHPVMDAGPDAGDPVCLGGVGGCSSGLECCDMWGESSCRPPCMNSAECETLRGAGSVCPTSFRNCTSPCNPFTNAGCGFGLVCSLEVLYTVEDDDAGSGESVVTICRTAGPPGATSCDDSRARGQTDCAEGFFCRSGSCVELCRPGMSGECPTGKTCVTLTSHEVPILIAGEGGGPVGNCVIL